MATIIQDGGQPTLDDLLTASEVAAKMKFSKRTLWRKLSKGELPKPVYIGGLPRWRAYEIRNWIEEGCPLPRSTKL